MSRSVSVLVQLSSVSEDCTDAQVVEGVQNAVRGVSADAVTIAAYLAGRHGDLVRELADARRALATAEADRDTAQDLADQRKRAASAFYETAAANAQVRARALTSLAEVDDRERVNVLRLRHYTVRDTVVTEYVPGMFTTAEALGFGPVLQQQDTSSSTSPTACEVCGAEPGAEHSTACIIRQRQQAGDSPRVASFRPYDDAGADG